MSRKFLLIISTVMLFSGLDFALSVEVDIPGTPDLLQVPTGEILGAGGYSFSLSLVRYNEKVPENPGSNPIKQEVVVGDFFKEPHNVYFRGESFFVPIRLTYGINDSLDISFGATLSTDHGQKVIADYYETGDEESDKRVYRQPMFNGNIGFKYLLKPEMGDGLPSLAIGGHVELGYAGDDKLDSRDKFIDDTPADGFPFFGMGLYMNGSETFNLFRFHGGVGIYTSSKYQKSTEAMTISFFGGAEVALTREIFFVGDIITKKIVNSSGMGMSLGIGLKYRLGGRTLNAGFGTAPELGFNITKPGIIEEAIKPVEPGETEAPLF